MWGADNYMAQAPRIKDWDEFKETILKFYTGELKGTPPVLSRPKKKLRKKLFKLPKLSKQQILTLLGALVLLGSLTLATVSLFQIKELKKEIADLEQEIGSSDNDYSSEISNLESKIDVEAREEKYLTDREKKILSLIMEGMSMREVGAKIGISHVMVLKIRNKIKEKYLQVNNEALN